MSLVSGWQGDVIPSATNQTIQVPRARNSDGSSITGPSLIRLTGEAGNTATLTTPRATPTPYPPATLDSEAATLVSAVSETPIGAKSGVVKIASTDWPFATCEKSPISWRPRPDAYLPEERIQDQSLLYELHVAQRSIAGPWHRLRGHA